VYPLTDALREELKLNRNTSGVYVPGFIAESPAALIGIQKGDIIIAVNGELVSDLAAFYKELREKSDRELWFTYIRGNSTQNSLKFSK
jgi:S1-C subfamily serine protease